jgi:hypothetical protein
MPDLKALQDELAERRRLLQNVQIMQMKPYDRDQLALLQKTELYMRAWVKLAREAFEHQRALEGEN